MARISVNRSALLLVGSLAAVLAIAVPVFGADPSAKPEPPGQTKQEKAAKGPEIALTLTGTVAKTTDAKGRPTFTLSAGGVTWELSAGPKWYRGDKNPLAAFVGKSVAITGTHHGGENELDVDTVDGKALRAAGKPPWAGGPKVVGKIHPGWKASTNDGKPGNGNARGQTKDKTGDETDDTGA
jgi:hypothetical protein